MKFICTADLHFTHIRPVHRIDNYVETSLSKITWIVLLANKHDAALLIAGDIFDLIKNIPSILVNRLSDILNKCKRGVFTVAGQHDMEYKSLDLEPSPYATLQRTGAITHVTETKDIIGLSWGEKRKRKAQPILLVHNTITPDEPPFFLKEAISARTAFRKYKGYKYIISGDYHHPFIKRSHGRILINCGPMLRSDKNQVDFRPRVYLLNTDTDKIKTIFIPIEISDKVFNIPDEIEPDTEFSDKMKEFIEKLNNSKEKPEYETVVKMILQETEAPEIIRDLTAKFIRQARENGRSK